MERISASKAPLQSPSNDFPWDWRSVLFILAIVEISSTRLVITEWVPFLYFTQTIGFIGTLIGLALAFSHFSSKAVLRLALAYTLVLVPAQLLHAVERTDWLWRDLTALWARFFTSLGQFMRSQPVYDQLFFTSLVTLGYWVIGLCAGFWLIRRKDFLGAVLPSGLAMLIVQNYDPGKSIRAWALALYIFISLLLLGRMYYLENHSFWKKSRFLLSSETTANLERGAISIAAFAVLIAWSLPGLITGIKPATQAWRNFSRPILDRLSDGVSALNSPGPGRSPGDFYSSELSLGQQASVGDNPVFYVAVAATDFVPVRYYWKGRSYDLYINGHWTNTSSLSEGFSPNVDELNLEYPDHRVEMEFTFTNIFTKQSLLYAPAETVWVNRAGKISSTPISSDLTDVTAWFASPTLVSGNKYQVRAWIANPAIADLRAAGREYPQWVTNKYLQVPEDIEPQLQALAEQISAPYDTAFDKAQAITGYLRETIIYDKTITTAAPANHDPVLWVLFDLKRGFCLYYASAETLMLRSIGIPARMSVGFAEGTFDELQERYVVTPSDAHAWPEVYFPGIGWVEFEPTGNQPPLDRPESQNDVATAATPNPNNAGVRPPATQEPVASSPGQILAVLASMGAGPAGSRADSGIILFAGLIILTAAGLIFLIVRRTSFDVKLTRYLAGRYARSNNGLPRWLDRWLRWTALSPMERTFQAINFSLFWLGAPQPIYKTTEERTEVLIKRLPAAEKEARVLLQEYQNTIYTPRAGDLAKARRAAFMILIKTWKIRLKEALQFLDYRYNQLR